MGVPVLLADGDRLGAELPRAVVVAEEATHPGGVGLDEGEAGRAQGGPDLPDPPESLALPTPRFPEPPPSRGRGSPSQNPGTPSSPRAALTRLRAMEAPATGSLGSGQTGETFSAG